MEILFYIFSVILIIALLALLIVPIGYGIKQARNKSNDRCKADNIIINITIKDDSTDF